MSEKDRISNKLRAENPKWKDVCKVFTDPSLVNTNPKRQSELYEDIFKVLERENVEERGDETLYFNEILSVVKAVELEMIRTYLLEKERKKYV